jgi:C-terminal processing protease CtpA/Prc
LNKAYVFPDVAKKMDEAVRARQAKKEYDAISSSQEFAKVMTEHLQEVSKDKHLRVRFSAEALPKSFARPSEEEIKRFEWMQGRQNYGFKKVERLDGGVGYLELEGFMPAGLIGETAAAAMTFLANSEAVIVDLRKNGGGHPGAVILLCSYFFDESTHLNDIYERPTDKTQQYWSLPVVPGKKLGKKDLYVLTSSRTFSGAEEFAYNMQAQKRGTIIGETTGGGAHPTMRRRVTDHFTVGVPFARSINPVTKTNWEGTGVKPDVAVPADQALLTAHVMILKKQAEKYAKDEAVAGTLKSMIAEKEKELAALKK